MEQYERISTNAVSISSTDADITSELSLWHHSWETSILFSLTRKARRPSRMQSCYVELVRNPVGPTGT